MARMGNGMPVLRNVFQVRNNSGPVHDCKRSLTYRFLCILSGRMRLIVGPIDEICGAGDLVYLPPRRYYETVFYPEPLRLINIFFDFSPNDGTMDERGFSQGRYFTMTEGRNPDPVPLHEPVVFEDVPEFNEAFVLKKFPDADRRCRELYRLWCSREPMAMLKSRAGLAELTADAAAYFCESRQGTGKLAARAVADYIEKHCDEKLTCASVAAAFSYHPNYLNRIVRELTGQSLHNAIIAAKIDRANRLLLETDLPVGEIAAMLAFHDTSHFSSVYSAVTGMKPSERRRLLRERTEPGHGKGET